MSFASIISNNGEKFVFSNAAIVPIIECTEKLVIPTTLSSGSNLSTGSLYYDNTSGNMKIYNGSAWVSGQGPPGPPLARMVLLEKKETKVIQAIQEVVRPAGLLSRRIKDHIKPV